MVGISKTIATWRAYNLLQCSGYSNWLTSPGANPHFADITYKLQVEK